MSNNEDIESASDGEIIARALEQVAESLIQLTPHQQDDVTVSISEFRGRNGENYFYGLVQMQEELAKAQYTTARVMAQANTLAVMNSMGLAFKPSGHLEMKDKIALAEALDELNGMSALHKVSL